MSTNTPDETWPRLRELPIAEREPFTAWLCGQASPAITKNGVPIPRGEQDAYYPWDYARWKKGLPAAD